MDNLFIEKVKVIQDLLNQGASEITITGTDIKVTKHNINNFEYFLKNFPNQLPQILNFNISQNTSVSTTFSIELDKAYNDLSTSKIFENKVDELSSQIEELKSELIKKKPNKTKLKIILQWSLNKGWEVFIKLAPIILNKMLIST